METKRQKFFKKKIKIASSENTKKKQEAYQNERSNTERTKYRQFTLKNPANAEVTVLGSCSYIKQNKDLRILRSSTDTEEKTKENEGAQSCQKIVAEENCQKQSSPDIYQTVKENNDPNLQEQTRRTVPMDKEFPIDTSIYTEKNTLSKHSEKGLDYSDEKTVCIKSETIRDQLIIEIEVEENLSDVDKMPHNNAEKDNMSVTQDDNNSTNTKDMVVNNEINTSQSDPVKELKNSRNTSINTHSQDLNGKQTKNVIIDGTTKEKEDLCIEENISVTRLDHTEQADDERLCDDDTKKQNKDKCVRQLKTIDTPMEESPLDKDKREFEMSDNLQPTITVIIPEKDMDLIRKSLENDHHSDDVDLPSFPDEEAGTEDKNRKRVNINKSYVDFLSDNEDFEWDSTSWKETGDEETSEDDKPAKKKKKKKRLQEEKVGDDGLKKKRSNKRKINKEARTTGKEYVKRDGSISKEKQLLPNPCTEKKCGHNCGEISETKRQNLFQHYWSLSAERKKDWLVAMSGKKEIKRKRNKDSVYRSNTFDYFINDGEGRRQVCLKFLLKTLDITQRYVYYTLSNASMGSAKSDARGKTVPANKTPDDVKKSAVNFIKSLPALPSHYCRKDSTRLYLPTELKNIKNLYRIYKEDRVNKGVDVLSEKIFREIFNKDFNLGFHVPKKDKCLKCLKYEGKDKTEPEIKMHLEEKEASKKRLECHRELGKKNASIICTSFDLQKVLNTPHGNSMLLFYSRKYAVYNLCFYESNTRKGFCFVWGESEGKRGGNEVATILQKYIFDVDERESVKKLILYSDSCPGQNKNKIVLAAIHNALLLSKNLETIQMNYLLPGHTEMTVDSIHSTIENSIRNTTVWAPSQWITVCQLARKEPDPYLVEYLTHEEFKNYDDFSDKYFKGNLMGKISKIRIATFKKSAPNVMTVKYSMKNDAAEETIPIISKPKALTAKYKSSLPITKAKHNDLKKLCDTGVIPRVFHAEYLNFPTCNGRDVLIDTDIEDDVDDN